MTRPKQGVVFPEQLSEERCELTWVTHSYWVESRDKNVNITSIVNNILHLKHAVVNWFIFDND